MRNVVLGCIAFVVCSLAVLLGVAIADFSRKPAVVCDQDCCKHDCGTCLCSPCTCCQSCPGKKGSGTIYAQRIVLKENPGSPHRLVLGADKDGAGLWIEHDNLKGPMVAIYVNKDQNCIGLYAPGKKGKGICLGLSVDAAGEPFIQVIEAKGKFHSFPASDLDWGKKPTGDAVPQ